jgi:two-component system, NarL family, nitrate/nitrite response regulator NarL
MLKPVPPAQDTPDDAWHSDTIGLVIVDDHRLFREATIATLRSDAHIQILGEGSSAVEALELACRLQPDLILLDITMPGGGLNAARAIAEACPIIKIVMLTFSEEEEDVLQALRACVRGYILKGVSGRELRGIVRAVSKGEVYIAPALIQGRTLSL